MTALEPQFLEVVATSAQELRSAFSALQAGVMDAGDLKVTAGGGTREVSVAAGVGFVRGTNIADQGLYRIRNDSAISSLAFELGPITANGTAFPRIDQIIARLLDQTHDGSGLRKWRPEVVTGVATTGATLDNRTGAITDAAIGNNWFRLADGLVPAGATTMLAANIRDRRLWARGAYYRILRNVANYSTTSGTMADVDATNLRPRIECSGVPLRISLSAAANHTAVSSTVQVAFAIDGALVDGTDATQWQFTTSATGSRLELRTPQWTISPSPGSHALSVQFAVVSAGTMSLIADTTRPLLFTVEEIVRANTSNG